MKKEEIVPPIQPSSLSTSSIELHVEDLREQVSNTIAVQGAVEVDSLNVPSSVLYNNSLITKTTAIAHEKHSLNFFKLKSISFSEIRVFLANVKYKSVQSAVKSVLLRLRLGLAFKLGIEISLKGAYGKDSVLNQPFLKRCDYLSEQEVISKRRNLTEKTLS